MDCIHKGESLPDDPPHTVRCFSNRFAGPDFAVRPESVCDHPCPFRNRPNKERKGEEGLPSLPRQAMNFAVSLAEHARAGLPTSPAHLLNARLRVCDGCDSRTDSWRCRECGCFLAEKASWLDQECPLGKWPAPDSVQPEVSGGGCGCGKKEKPAPGEPEAGSSTSQTP